MFETSPLTTEEVKACCADLRLLNKSDFKMLLKWRLEMLKTHKEEIKQIAVDGAKLVKQLSEEYEGNFLFEYSPESFTGTEVDYAVEVCNAVLDIMQPTPERPMIINLPVTVEMSMPHVYANQIEYCDKHLKYRDSVIISTHPHNDRGTGVACAELAVLAGAQRVECCLFGNGERTGNVDAITLAMDVLAEANTDLQNRFSPALGRRAAEIFAQLTDNRYDAVTLDRSFRLMAEPQGSYTLRDAQFLSAGAADQLYLAVRLAICELVLPQEEPAPLILDDALTNFDDARCAAALAFLRREAKQRQILLFTCHSREAALLRDAPDVRARRLPAR